MEAAKVNLLYFEQVQKTLQMQKHAARVKNSTDLGEGKRSVTEIMCIRSYCQGFLKILTIFGSLRPTRI